MTSLMERQYYRDSRLNTRWGVNANAVRSRRVPGYDGAGVALCCLLEAWGPHRDLPAVGAAPAQDPAVLNRGKGILGILLARDDGEGIVGLAPGAYPLDACQAGAGAPVPPRVRPIPPPGGVSQDLLKARGQAIADAIRSAVQEIPLGCGDVLLIDAQAEHTHGPAETLPYVYDAIRSAVALGVVVVEPAGEAKPGEQGMKIDSMLRSVPSGALIVGALNGCGDRDRHSNYGARVQLCALGANHQVFSLSGDGHDWMVNCQTRAAAAIVAGAAASAQGMTLARTGSKLLPAQLVESLRDCGTSPSAGSLVGRIPELLVFYRQHLQPLIGDVLHVSGALALHLPR